MQGSKTGVSARLKEVAGNLIDLPDCSCHNIHLLSNDEIKNDSQGILKNLLKFVELFSDFLASTPKARLVFKHCSKVLGLNSSYTFSPTRFLDVFWVLETLLDQFAVVCKLVKIFSSRDLKSIVSRTLLLVHLDQFFIHHKPLYDLTSSFQANDLGIHTTLELILGFLSKLWFRLGNWISLQPNDYCSELFDEYDEPIGLK